ncbi:TonB family C-terminal domain-containing protein [Prevotella sp. ne3005]|uniref:energy transducer TonB n=1 Tax=Prevotella sp. ne3005 TaxID=1761887 RepID=UPI0008C59C49|nr:energy transducer TonB [Prevotella sp. ne3005]SEN18451.1 TonB family C-terminal domain-containing protein [Prevotella sp. ne3005]
MKELIILSLMAVFGLTTASAQKTVVAEKNQQAFDVVEQMPEFPGGIKALLDYLCQNVKYPADAEKQKIEGRVIANFVVETDGSISNVEVFRPVFPSLDAEAVRVLSAMPKWKPGMQSGKVVRVKYTVPISFNLK